MAVNQVEALPVGQWLAQGGVDNAIAGRGDHAGGVGTAAGDKAVAAARVVDQFHVDFAFCYCLLHCAVLARKITSVGKYSTRGTTPEGDSSASVVARAPSSTMGTRTVERAGVTSQAIGISSKPTTEIV